MASITFKGVQKSYNGKDLEFVISEFNPARNRCIGDRRRLLVAEEKKKKLLD